MLLVIPFKRVVNLLDANVDDDVIRGLDMDF